MPVLTEELIVERRGPNGQASWEIGSGLAAQRPVWLVVETQTTPEAQALADAVLGQLRTELEAAAPEFACQAAAGTPATLPSGGEVHAASGCWKLLLVVGDGTQALEATPTIEAWAERLGRDRDYRMLVVVPRLRPGFEMHQVLAVLPLSVRKLNTIAYLSAKDAVADVFVQAGWSTAFRVFISYRRKDTQAFAEELADRLARRRFEVFLDQFRIEPGVDFQMRLTEHLYDKGMVVVLESPDILGSRWTRFEINFAKRYRLGLLALHFPGGPNISHIDSAQREEVPTTDPNVLGDAAWERLLTRIRVEHGRARVRRRLQLRHAMVTALRVAGLPEPTPAPDGFLTVDPPRGGIRYDVLLAASPPTLAEFHLGKTKGRPAAECLLVAPSRFIDPDRREQLAWLSKQTQVHWLDEGRMLSTARRIAQGMTLE